MTNRFTNFMHIRLGKGMVTCAIDHPCDKGSEGIVHVGVSMCSPRDIFIKAKGREKALGRLNANGTMTFSFHSVKDVSFKAQVLDTLLMLTDEMDAPHVFDNKLSIPSWSV